MFVEFPVLASELWDAVHSQKIFSLCLPPPLQLRTCPYVFVAGSNKHDYMCPSSRPSGNSNNQHAGQLVCRGPMAP